MNVVPRQGQEEKRTVLSDNYKVEPEKNKDVLEWVVNKKGSQEVFQWLLHGYLVRQNEEKVDAEHVIVTKRLKGISNVKKSVIKAKTSSGK